MAKYAKNIVELAKSWIGRNESAGTHKYIIDIYNAHKPLARNYKVKYTDAWCATTISALAIKLGYTSIIPTECSCGHMIELFKKIGSWVESDSYKPKTGDIIFYDWDDGGNGDCTGWSDHVGIVEKLLGTTITVIEGNKNNAVERRTLQVNGKYIRGYGVPKYDTPTTTKSLEEIAKEVLSGKWGNGDDRKKRLTEAGYNYNAVQTKVNELVSKPTTPKKTVEEVAKEVILGKWGNSPDRKTNLEKAGYDYATIQKKVNELLK